MIVFQQSEKYDYVYVSDMIIFRKFRGKETGNIIT